MKLKRHQLSLVAAVIFSTNANSSVMEELFNKSTTQYNRPSTVNSATRNGVTFGGGSYRVKQINQNVLSFQPPKLTSGCGGVDFFAGSFSVINSDQLVQMGRAIAQGVPSYAFGLALSSVCPSCKSVMDEIQQKLEKFNQLASSGCEGTVSFLQNEFGSEIETFQSSMKIGALDNMANTAAGYISDFGEGMQKRGNTDNIANKAAELGVDIEGNAANKALEAASIRTMSHPDIPGLSGTNLKSLIMSLTGYTSIAKNGNSSSSDSGVTIRQEAPLFTVNELVFGKVGSNTMQFYTCSDHLKCLNPSKVSRSHNGLIPNFESVALSALHKTINRPSAGLTVEEESIQQLSGLSYAYVTKAFGSGNLVLGSKIMAQSAAVSTFNSIVYTIKNMVPLIESRANDANDPLAQGQVAAYLKKVREIEIQLSDALLEYNRRLDAEKNTFVILSSLNQMKRK